MKKKFNIRNIVVVVVIGLSATSCEKLIETPSNLPGQLVTEKVFTDSIGSVNGVVGIYSKAFSTYGPLAGYLSIFPSMSSDDMISSSDAYSPIFNNKLTPGNEGNQNEGTAPIWSGFYGNTMIYHANAAIEGLNASKGITETLRSQLIGECEVVRSLSYFYLTNLFGAVPLAQTSDYTVNSKLPRSSTEDVYKLIISDLSDASRRLKDKYPSAGRARPNKYTALALLSRVQLYRQQWVKADSAATAVINAGIYRLENIDNVFLLGNEEVIWQGLSTAFYSWITQEGPMFVPFNNTSIPTYPLRKSLVDAFEPTDLRRSRWIGTSTVSGIPYYYAFKYKNTYSSRPNGATEAEVVFRLSEQYLIRAEARINQGDLGGGKADIDKVRERAGLLPTTAATKDQLLAAVLKERRTEFFCEWAHRWLDLKRHGLVNSTMAAEKPGIWPTDGHQALYPVPYVQVTSNPGWAQNPGY
ncbi:RagB/SusD family nutrient uptake outer membrane protein [Pedobacter hiemivivus]|uniref:RagB/SusD family nutrient uptake outer membrane protein n=1 Tax=Pedobacter hiemivivus TaxID=2530454 RepID=A0A4R0NHQ8_9SPHI|nr:RagB/SusD family nutrient uptake outer membrane protein [Pedobacter hiemivivus]TCC98833.1 RagB/SusD family nutrient uptake outer membrane protein [Pedobacter hiemivivus]